MRSYPVLSLGTRIIAWKHNVSSVTAIIATHNRPELLLDALESLFRQNRPPNEIIVVDDGSDQPAEEHHLNARFPSIIRVLRNEKPLGLAYSRNLGAMHATGSYLIHLDDDDLFAPETIEEALALFLADPDLQVVFLGVEGFGRAAEHFNRVQREGVNKIIETGRGHSTARTFIRFHKRLFTSLLQTVPSAFQHVMVPRTIWTKVSNARRMVYREAGDSEEAAMRRVNGPLRDSEWALYAAALCPQTILINRPRYLARCNGQGQFSRPEQRLRQLESRLDIKSHLQRAAAIIPEFKNYGREIRTNYIETCFDASYQYFHAGDQSTARKYLARTLCMAPRWRYLRFGLRMLIPNSAKLPRGALR